MQRLFFVIPALAAGLLARPALAQTSVPPLAPAAVTVRPVPVEVPLTRSVWVETTPVLSAHPADPPSRTQSPYHIEPPLQLFNSKIILSEGALARFNPQDIKEIMVYKGDDMPASWRLTPNGGVVDLLLKKGVRVPSRSLASLKRQAHLHGPVRFAIDGRLLPDATLRIATRSIKGLEARPALPDGSPAELNILLTKSPPTSYPPGKEPRIMVRGTAGR